MDDGRHLEALKDELRRWQRRAVLSWLGLSTLAFATCANYSATDDLVARRQLTVGQEATAVHVQNGVITVKGKDGRKAILDAAGITFHDAAGKAVAALPAKK